MQRCTHCKKEKKVTDFHKRNYWGSKTKRASWCRDCDNARLAVYQDKNREKLRAYWRKYDKMRKLDPVKQMKRAARWKLREAVSQGLIQRLPCKVCGTGKVDGHHTDYEKPFDVEWLCKPHHYKTHRMA